MQNPILTPQIMMNDEFEVYYGALGLVQPNQHWDYNNPIGFSMNHISLSNPLMVDGEYYANTTTMEAAEAELSEFMDHVRKQQYSDISRESTAAAGFSMEGTYTPPLPSCEYRPQKSVEVRNYAGNTDDNGLVPQASSLINEEGWRNEQVLSSTDEHALGLLTLLLQSAVAISLDNLGEANQMLLELTQVSSPYSPSCSERVVAYFAKAMAGRVMSSWLGISMPLVSHRAINGAFQIFDSISPFIKFAQLTSNQTILEAFHLKDRVHIIDLDIMQGLQWPPLFHILAARPEGRPPPHVRMTGMGASVATLEETGKQLSKFAKLLGLSFEFNPIAKKFCDLIEDPSMIQTRRGEAVAVHWLQHSLYDATGTDWKTMRLLELISPRVITVVEQELKRTGSFLDRFVGSLHYYSTIFDSLGSSFPVDDPNRHTVEQCLLSGEINNVLAVGGPARIGGEEKFSNWRMELAERGFLQVPMSSNSIAQAQLVLDMLPPSHGYTLHQGDGTLRLGWKDTALYTASAWTSHFPRRIIDVDSSRYFNIHSVVNGLM